MKNGTVTLENGSAKHTGNIKQRLWLIDYES